MRELVSFLGDVYECAFKLGFLKDKIGNYEKFKERQVFERLKYKSQELDKPSFISILELFEKHIPFNVGLAVPKELEGFGLGNSEENYLRFIFLTGYYQGYFYGKKFKNVQLVKYSIGEESSLAGVYKNADLIFIHENTLYVVDFKLAGAVNNLTQLFVTKQGKIPYHTYGLPVNISLGELKFESFVKNVLRIKDKIFSLKDVFAELKGFLQVLSYAVDYFCEKGRGSLVEVCLSLLYPLAEPFSARFYLDGKDLQPYGEEIRKLYESLKSVDWIYAQAENPSKGTISRLRRELPPEIESLKDQMRKKEEEEEVIKPDSISLSRADVSKRLEEFFKREEPIKVLCLLHSAGSGKTSQTRERILNSEGNHIVIYMATRKVLLDREYSQLLKVKNKYDIALIYEKRSGKKKNMVENVGDVYKSQSEEKGILYRTVEKISQERDKHRFIWAFVTQQAIVNLQNSKESTVRHLNDITSKSLLRKYSIHIILDEFFGHQNGLFAIEELLKFLHIIQNRNGRANLYLFDANGYTPKLLEKLLVEYKNFGVIPSSVILSELEKEVVFQERDIKFFAYAQHGYPSPEIRLRRKFIELSEKGLEDREQELINKIVLYVKETFKDKENSTAFMFVQNKEHIKYLSDRLKEEGFNVLIATADSRKTQDRINKGEEDIILATSAISRGIDLSRPHKPVNHIYTVIYDWGIEHNLVELIQSVSRARGDEKTEEQPKNMHLIYAVSPINDYILDRIIEYIGEESVDKYLLALLYTKHSLEQRLELDYVVSSIIKQFVKSSEGRVLVPVPSQYKTRYIENSISRLESAINFLEGISQIENNNKDIGDLLRTLRSALSVSAVDIRLNEYSEYYHPYLLFESQKVRSSFDNDKRKKVKALYEKVKNTLKEHNEERTRELEEVINNTLPGQQDYLPVLIPVYSIVLVKHFLQPGEKVVFELKSRVGRGGADVLMGGENPKTICFRSEKVSNEYACILLTEDYPYKEVLSGRFVKFPVEFLKALLEEENERV